MNAADREAIRQQRETFEQLKRQDRHWFLLRLTMGYAAIALLVVIFVFCALIIAQHTQFPVLVVKSAAATLFADVAALVYSVWKVVLNPNFHSRLRPVTNPGHEDDAQPPGA